ncbi:hypothetical protein [Jeotgalibacillus soli]|uniref:Uncharacterized protein n=1 Tax=Jeotgalibacillus soli TaxID=889306 RepID=A0A0C2S6C2_9BACL|nr:hypothetical protein [Jeotgalibacillus soli]KIL49564.1 hypothetical protein KP78_10320 [Jeotgalibacillus soli]
MLTFEEKLAIIESFPELTRNDVSLGRVNFHYQESSSDKKNVVYHLHPNGNGFVFTAFLHEYETDNKGMVNIREYNEEELRTLISKSIRSLAPKKHLNTGMIVDAEEETWTNRDNQTLTLIQEDDMWSVYAGLNLDGVFTTYNEACSYLEEEGFKRV